VHGHLHAAAQQTDIHGMEAVNVLGDGDSPDYGRRVDLRGQRQLD